MIVRNVDDRSFILRSFRQTKKIKQVELLENHRKVDWEMTEEGLQVRDIVRPAKAFPVYVLKVVLD